MGITALNWDLPRLSPDELRSAELSLALLPNADQRTALQRAAVKALAEHFGAETALQFVELEHCAYGAWVESCGELTHLLECQLEPSGAPCYLQVEHDLLSLMIDQLLGGKGERQSDPTPFSETELGVLQYLMMHVLAAVHQAAGRSAEFHLRYQRAHAGNAQVRACQSPSETVAVATWKLSVSDQVGYVRILWPLRFAEQVVQAASAGQQGPSLERVHAFGGERLDCWLDAGRCELNAADLASLETGDVVLLDDSTVQLVEGKLRGDLALRLGQGEVGAIRCQISEDQTCVVRGME